MNTGRPVEAIRSRAFVAWVCAVAGWSAGPSTATRAESPQYRQQPSDALFNGLISKRDRREQDWWLGRRTSCHWQTEARDHWLEFGFNGDLQTVFAQEPRRRLEPNVWQHLAVTRQGSLLTLYLNGTPMAKQTATAARNKPSQAPVVLGTIQFPWDTANGEERDVGLCLAPIGNDLDPTKTHDVTLEIHPEEPSRRGIWGPFDARGMESVIAKPKYRGKWIRASHLMIRGQIVEE